MTRATPGSESAYPAPDDRRHRWGGGGGALAYGARGAATTLPGSDDCGRMGCIELGIFIGHAVVGAGLLIGSIFMDGPEIDPEDVPPLTLP